MSPNEEERAGERSKESEGRGSKSDHKRKVLGQWAQA